MTGDGWRFVVVGAKSNTNKRGLTPLPLSVFPLRFLGFGA